MVRRMLWLVSVAALLVASQASAKGPFGAIHVGNWRGGAFTNDADGTFTHCQAAAQYQSGIVVTVGMTAAESWGLIFAHHSWQVEANEQFPIELTFDGQQQFHVFGTTLANDHVRVNMPPTSAVLAVFRKASGMTAFAKGQAFQFRLQATSELLPALSNCVASVKAHGLPEGGEATFAALPNAPNAPRTGPRPVAVAPAVAAAAPVVGTSMNPAPPSQPSPELQIEAVELASNFIIKSSLHEPRVLSRAETPVELVSTGAAWRSQEATGFVRIVPPQREMKGLDVAAAVVANDAKNCRGKFASGRLSELVDSDVVFRGFASCEDSGGSRTSQYFIVPRRKGGFVMFSVVASSKIEQAHDLNKEERLSDFRKAAWTAAQ